MTHLLISGKRNTWCGAVPVLDHITKKLDDATCTECLIKFQKDWREGLEAERLLDSKYIEIHDTLLRRQLEGCLSQELLEYHSLSAVVNMGDGQWLLKLGPDIEKRMKRHVK